MMRDRSVGVVDVDVVRDRLAGVVVLEVDDRLAAVDVSDKTVPFSIDYSSHGNITEGKRRSRTMKAERQTNAHKNHSA